MWIRSAFWVGKPNDADSAAFDRAVDAEIVPTLQTLPGVNGARALWPRRLEDSPPAIYCQILVDFTDLAALETMLASPERLAFRTRVRELAAIFDGTISHIDYEVRPA